MRIAGVVLLLLALGVTTAIVLAARRWRARSTSLVEQLTAAGSPDPSVYSAEALGDLPGPVVRYFRTALRDGQPIIHHVRLEKEGGFLLKAPERDGIRIPLRGEVEWMLPEGAQPTWRGRVTSIRFDPAGSGSR